MPKRKTDLLRGTLDLLVMKAVSLEALHGVGIARRIGQISKGAFGVSYGSLFPSLHRMDEKGWVSAEWSPSENNRRARYYQLTALGRKQFELQQREWNRVVETMARALQAT